MEQRCGHGAILRVFVDLGQWDHLPFGWLDELMAPDSVMAE
jgi:hypothetical protein